MNLDIYLTTIIQRAVKEAIREEMETLKGELIAASKVNNTFSKEEREIPGKRIIRASELAKMLSVTKTTLWRMEKDGRLPNRIKISNRAYGWMSSDIEYWLESRRQSTDQK